MVRTIVYSFVAIVLFGAIATPGLGLLAVFVVPFLLFAFVWRIALAITTRGHVSDAILHTRRRQFLGPGGPDDPFAGIDDELEQDERPREISRAEAA